MWCSASSWIASPSSLGVTLGSGTRFTIASRPETEMIALVPLMPAFSTHSLIASVTTWGSRMVPSAITSRGSGTIAKDFSARPPLLCTSSTSLTALVPMSSPNVAGFLPSPNSAIFGSRPSPDSDPASGSAGLAAPGEGRPGHRTSLDAAGCGAAHVPGHGGAQDLGGSGLTEPVRSEGKALEDHAAIDRQVSVHDDPAAHHTARTRRGPRTEGDRGQICVRGRGGDRLFANHIHKNHSVWDRTGCIKRDTPLVVGSAGAGQGLQRAELGRPEGYLVEHRRLLPLPDISLSVRGRCVSAASADLAPGREVGGPARPRSGLAPAGRILARVDDDAGPDLKVAPHHDWGRRRWESEAHRG